MTILLVLFAFQSIELLGIFMPWRRALSVKDEGPVFVFFFVVLF